MRRWWAALGVAALVACAGTGHDAPYTEPADGPGRETACGTLAGARTTLKGTAVREDFAPLGTLVRTRLVDTGKWRQAVRVGLEVFRREPPRGLGPALHALRSGDSLAHLTPHVRAILWYFLGSPKLALRPDEAFAAGPHEGPIVVATEALRVCSPSGVMLLAHRLLSVRVACPACATGTRLYASALLRALADLLADPQLVAALDAIEFTDQPGRPAAIGREAFQLLADLVVDGIASPSFTPDYYENNLRVVVQDVVGRRLEATTQARLNALLDALGQGLQPDVGILAPLQEVLRCVRRQDPGHEVAGMFFDYVRLDSLEWREFVPNLALTFDSAGGAALNAYLARVTGLLAGDSSLAHDAVGVALALLVDGTAMELFRALDALQGAGVAAGALELAERILGACARPPP